jgi:hypothetical protein
MTQGLGEAATEKGVRPVSHTEWQLILEGSISNLTTEQDIKPI